MDEGRCDFTQTFHFLKGLSTEGNDVQSDEKLQKELFRLSPPFHYYKELFTPKVSKQKLDQVHQ